MLGMSTHGDPTIIPTPADAETGRRWAHTRMVRRMLDGGWQPDLDTRLAEEVGRERTSAWGIAKTTCMPLTSICRETAALYLTEPEVYSGDVPIFGVLADRIAASGLWARMPRYQSMVIGLRECALRVSVSAGGAVQYRPVYPDLLDGSADPDAPDVPTCIRELRYREGLGWCWDVLDVSDAASPVYRVETFGGLDVSGAALGGDYSGESYPYRRSDGTPVIPYVLHHAESLGDRLWNWRGNWETVQACLDLAVNYTFLGHCLRDASFPQRYTLDCGFVGAGTIETPDGGSRVDVVADPAVIMRAESTQEGRQPIISQFSAAADPAMLEGVISALANRIAIDAGLPPADIQRMGGPAKSGYAIALSNEGKRSAARRYAPGFRPVDERLIGLTAILLNRATGTSLPESGYQVRYRDLPLSPEELAARRANVIELRGAGLISRTKAYQELNPGITEATARRELAAIDAERTAATLL